jgi:hypothetical protein
MEVGVAGDDIFVLMKVATTHCDDSIEIFDGVKGERLIDERPEMFGRL